MNYLRTFERSAG